MIIDISNLKFFGLNNRLIIVRDDAFPFFFGGNKARKMVRNLKEIENGNYNAIVTTGGIQSNHCRVTALACALKGWECRLVLHGSEKKFYSEKGNALLMRSLGAEVVFVKPNEIKLTMDSSIEEFKALGLSPYYLRGGGHNRSGTEAYVSAMIELKNNLPEGYSIDNIFLASGTGSTQAGLIIGSVKAGWLKTKVHGISIARQKSVGVQSVKESLGFICSDPEEYSDKIIFRDDFLFGGYSCCSTKLRDFISYVARSTGIILDPTYTGKAFWGMINIVNKEKTEGDILFWHTGGLLNLMA